MCSWTQVSTCFPIRSLRQLDKSWLCGTVEYGIQQVFKPKQLTIACNVLHNFPNICLNESRPNEVKRAAEHRRRTIQSNWSFVTVSAQKILHNLFIHFVLVLSFDVGTDLVTSIGSSPPRIATNAFAKCLRFSFVWEKSCKLFERRVSKQIHIKHLHRITFWHQQR